MEISSSIASYNANKTQSSIKTSLTQKISKEDVNDIKEALAQQVKDIVLKSTTIQKNLGTEDKFKVDYEAFQSFLKEVGYEGKAISDLSKEEAEELISEDGLFGIKQTSQRIANFVINGAGGDEKMFRAGREGMIQGFKDAEKLWGDKLPEISKKTMEKSIELVDNAMSEAGFSIIDTEA
jgi:hypothetical protein